LPLPSAAIGAIKELMILERKTALIAGGLGVIGRNLVNYLSDRNDWNVVALSRRAPRFPSKATFISVDLLDRDDCRQKLSHLSDVTHIFHAAYQEQPSARELVAPNRAMLRNVVETVEPIAARLARVVLFQGAKAYGVHLGPFKTPAKETDPRHMPPNFYYDQEDFLKAVQEGKPWAWTILRPDVVCGFAVGNPMNLAMLSAVYAVISKELGLPLRFPGKPGAYGALAQVTDAGLLARATEWAATNPACANEIFNITNGDFFRWQALWPTFARFFHMEYAPPQTISLTEVMADKAPVWEAIVRKHRLQPHAYADIAAWPFGDFIFGCEFDVMSDTTKVRRFGFHDVVDSEEMFLRLFREFQHNRIIPAD
jgi:nucleoside-diphosphate-sugar epimerase